MPDWLTLGIVVAMVVAIGFARRLVTHRETWYRWMLGACVLGMIVIAIVEPTHRMFSLLLVLVGIGALYNRTYLPRAERKA